MPSNYLLPCQCGKKTQVDSSQAGLNVRCACGAELTVPTMRGLAALERVEAAPRATAAEPAANWETRQGIVFLGSTIALITALAAFCVWWFRMPEPVTLQEGYQENNRAFLDQHPPEELIDVWHNLREGIEQAPMEMALDRYDRIVAEVLGWEYVLAGVGALGLVLVAIGLAIRPGRRVPAPASARVAQTSG